VLPPAASDLQSEAIITRICNPLLTFHFHEKNLFSSNYDAHYKCLLYISAVCKTSLAELKGKNVFVFFEFAKWFD
jgi:hypothetical protein